MMKYISFEMEPPQSSYKTHFFGTSLGAALTRMSSEKVAPTRLKHQECKCGQGGKKAPIRYVPEEDPVQEALDLNPESIKYIFVTGSETQIMVQSGHGTYQQPVFASCQ